MRTQERNRPLTFLGRGADVLKRIGLAVVVVGMAGCALEPDSAPPLAGPSELGLSLEITATPDIITQDGVSKAVIQVLARNYMGQPAPGVTLRAEIAVGQSFVDFGTLSNRVVSTGSDGRTQLTYTAPPAPPPNATDDVIVNVLVTPVGSNYANATSRTVSIRLARPGVILPPNGVPVPRFFYSPSSPKEDENVRFDGSASTDDGTIVSYVWNMGDGRVRTGVQVNHSYSLAGTYRVTLTVTDDRGFTATSAPTDVAVGTADAPSADFTFSPTAPLVGQVVNVNGQLSTAAPGFDIKSYRWDFGDGTMATGPTAQHAYGAAGTYTIVLVVTDSNDRVAAVSKTVEVAVPGP